MPLNPEEVQQKQVFDWAAMVSRQMYPELRWLHHIPNGGKRGKVEAAILKMIGVKRGVSDISLPVPRGGYNGLYIEMKAAGGKKDPEQKEFISFVKAQGYYADFCWSGDEAIALIEAYIKLPKPKKGE